MNETLVTVQGYLGTDVTLKTVREAQVATFRVASTPRKFDRNVNGFVDQETNWFTVNAWRALGRHCASSFAVGDPVLVHGRLTCQSWTNQDGQRMTTLVVEAVSAGHDLSKGTSTFEKAPAANSGDGGVDAALAELNSMLTETAGQMTSDGAVVADPAA